MFFENAKPTKPTITKSAPTTIIQWGYCSPSRSAFISTSPWHSIQRAFEAGSMRWNCPGNLVL